MAARGGPLVLLAAAIAGPAGGIAASVAAFKPLSKLYNKLLRKGAKEPTILLEGTHHFMTQVERPVSDFLGKIGPRLKLVEGHLTVWIVAAQKGAEIYGSKRAKVRQRWSYCTTGRITIAGVG
jgi:hypothetical protein